MQRAKNGEVARIVKEVTGIHCWVKFTDKLTKSRKYKFVMDFQSDEVLTRIRQELNQRGYLNCTVRNYAAQSFRSPYVHQRNNSYNKLVVEIPFEK